MCRPIVYIDIVYSTTVLHCTFVLKNCRYGMFLSERMAMQLGGGKVKVTGFRTVQTQKFDETA